jgi:sirohydrochlorin cobaltochelatase
MSAGVLVIAHGSRNAEWVAQIEQLVASVRCPVWIAIAYLESVEGQTIADGVERLQRQGVTRILAIPLFMTAGSTHVHEIQYALGLVPALTIESDITRIAPTAHIVWGPLLEAGDGIVTALYRRIRAFSHLPVTTLLIVAHGSDAPTFHVRWEQWLQTLIKRVQSQFHFVAVNYATLHPDNVTVRARALAKHHSLAVVPLFLSAGYFTKTLIPARIAGIPATYTGDPLLPDEAFTDDMQQTIDRFLQTGEATTQEDFQP